MEKIKNYFMLLLIPLLIIVISGCEDRDGITYPPITTTPIVSTTNPVNGALEVPFNQQITATFSEEMNSSTITTASFTLMQGTSFVSGTVSYTGTTAAFVPSSNLSPNTVYTATITTTAKNLTGNGLASNYIWSFTTGSTAAVTPPTVSSTDPVNAATGVPINQKIAVTFSVAMDATTITSSTFTLLQGTTPVSGFVSYSGTTAIFAPTSNLLSNTAYTAIITTGATDLAGNELENNYEWNFITGATAIVTPPTVSLTEPANAETNVPLNQKVAATFSKTMNATTITSGTFTLRQGTTSISGFTSYSGTTAIFAPASNLSPNTVYTATITTGATDLAGNALENNYEWSFTTGSSPVISPPTIVSTDPEDTEVCVPLNKNITAVFSKPMNASTITTAIFTLMRNDSFIAGTVSYEGTTATYNPTDDLLPNATYTATITTGARDLTGTPIEENYVWSFTTVVPYTVSLTSNPVQGGTTNGSGTFNSCDLVTVTATPNDGYDFVNWTENGIEVSTNTSYEFTLEGNTSLVANFTPIQYSVTLSSNPAAGGSTSGGGTYNSGTSVTITATPNSEYDFVNWTENGIEVSTNASYTFTLEGNTSLVANFTPIQYYSVTLSSNPAAGGSTNGGGTYNSGSSVTITATPNSEYDFVNWTENGIEVSANASYTFTINGNRSFTANFALSGPAPVNLGSAGNFAILAGSGVTNTGFTFIYGDGGSFPTATIDGFPPGVVDGTLYRTADPIVGTAKDDLTTAYNDAQGRSLNAISLPGQLGGLTLAPGLYVNSSTSGISGTGPQGILTLDAGGNPNAVWIFKMGSTLITDPGTSIVLAGGAKWENIYWSVGTSATLGTNSVFYGNILADQAISLNTGASLRGRALTRIAAVTLDASVVDKR